jgi:superfamily I DNA and RNA helicase
MLMPLQVFPKETAARNDPGARIVIEHLAERQDQLGLAEALLFYNFPLFREDDKLLVADLVLISPLHGVLLISTPSTNIYKARDQLEGAFNQIFSRLVRYPRLRTGRAQLRFEIDACVWLSEGVPQNEVSVGLPSLDLRIDSLRREEPLNSEVFEELVSVLDGSKALIKPKDRKIDGYSPQTRVVIISKLEEEIRRFDRDQRVAYMAEIAGLQRIQGLAGSGKTVVLALKAALTAVREPDARIAVTFYTKSLYQHIKQLITRFYRMHEDRDPDWKKIQVLHAWGGATIDGLYYQTARRFGHEPLNFAQAKAISSRQPFAAACKRLLSDAAVAASFDYVFVDEAQDFPPEFMKLALRLAIDEKLVIAYDVFQTIFDVETPTAASLFGTDGEADPHVEFDEEIVLHKCYRNPREILVCAHAIGFGIYGPKIVQMLEMKEHWQDFGYEVQGELVANQEAVVSRPRENSPSSISDANTIDQIMSCDVFKTPGEEIQYVVERIKQEIAEQGVPAEDVLVICADDRNAGMYLGAIGEELLEAGIKSNNIHAQNYGLRDFQQDGAVTLSTVYKAKGNEAYSVYLVGIDALFWNPTPRSRNIAFTGMTRAKGWLCVTGVGVAADRFAKELAAAKMNFPALRFTYPSAEDLVFMKRDLIMVEPSVVDDEISVLGEGLEPEEFEKILRKKLREVQTLKRSKKRLR